MNFCILGAGSWGLAIAHLLRGNSHHVHVYCRTEKQAKHLSEERNDPRLPGVHFDSETLFSSDLKTATLDADVWILACPSQAVRELAVSLGDLHPQGRPLILSLIKGVERETQLHITQILEKVIPWVKKSQLAVLSGPSHAEEVVKQIPTSVVIASHSLTTAKKLQSAFKADHFRVYTSDDVVGVEIAGAVKNVIAIATGILDGLGYGDNTKGALLSRGLAEIARLGECLGGNVRTFAGLSGLGDLVTTCMSQHSRNRFVGEAIGKGKSLQEILEQMNMVAEGVYTAQSAWELAQKYRVDMPITQAVRDVLYEGRDPREASLALMRRDPKTEIL